MSIEVSTPVVRKWSAVVKPGPRLLRPAVFLDRDGVINGMVYNSDFGLVDSPQNADQFSLLPGVAEAVHRINELGLLTVVVSNQPGIAKGKYQPAMLEAVTSKMHDLLAEADATLDGVYYCLHHPDALLPEYRVACNCRKPRSGLLHRAADELGIDLRASYMVGDGLTDVQAGRAAGCTTIFLGKLKCDICLEMERQRAQPDLVAGQLAEAVGLIERHRRGAQPNGSARACSLAAEDGGS